MNNAWITKTYLVISSSVHINNYIHEYMPSKYHSSYLVITVGDILVWQTQSTQVYQLRPEKNDNLMQTTVSTVICKDLFYLY